MAAVSLEAKTSAAGGRPDGPAPLSGSAHVVHLYLQFKSILEGVISCQSNDVQPMTVVQGQSLPFHCQIVLVFAG